MGEQEVTAGSYLLLAFAMLRIPMRSEGDKRAVRRVGALLQRKYPVILRIVDYYGRLVQKPSFWRSE